MSKIEVSRCTRDGVRVFSLAIFALLGAASLSLGQQPPPSVPNVSGQAPQPGSAPSAPQAGPPAAPAKNSAPDAAALDYLYNKKPQEGSAAAVAAQDKMRSDDKTLALDALAGTDSPLEPDFEQYLNAAEADPGKLKAYLANYDKVIALLLQKKPADAYQALFAMAAYEGDAGISRQLANRVQTVWDADAYTHSVLSDNERLKQQVRQSNWNVDQYADDGERKFEDQSARQSHATVKKNNGGALPADNGASNEGNESSVADAAGGAGAAMAGKMRMTDEFLQSLDGKARLKLNEIKIKGINDKAKTEFATYISTLYKSGRLLHTVAAADFYRVLFQDGDLPTDVANQAEAASEIVRKVNQAVEVVRFKVGSGQLSTGSAILREAFKLDPDHPALQGLERTSKLKVADYYGQLKKMQNLIESREFGGLESLISETEKMAKDFDATKAQALVNGVKLDSRMHLGQAKLAAQMGDQQKALDEFKAAATAWPGNPDLQTASSGYFDSQDSKNKGVAEFDRDISEGNFRAVYDNQLPFLASVKGDADREGKFKNALEKVRDAEMATEKADLLVRNGDSCGAWETLEAAAKNWPDDGKLNKLRAEMSIKAAEFVSAINKAQEAEIRKEYGYSLTLYVQAQRRYPASQMANEAITRLSSQILGTKPLASSY
jgi:hypothetical protein